MKIRTEPLLGGAALSFVILLVINLLSTFISMNYMQQVMTSVLVSMSDPNAPLPTGFGSPMLSLIGCLACIAPLAAGIGAGVVYARQYAKLEPITGSLISGGAASGAIGFFLSGLASGIVAAFMMIPLMNQIAAMDPSLAGSLGTMMGTGVFSGIIGSICGSVLYALFGAILGAIGAAIGTPKPAKPAVV